MSSEISTRDRLRGSNVSPALYAVVSLLVCAATTLGKIDTIPTDQMKNPDLWVADTVYLGASFHYLNSEDTVTVSLHGNEAGYYGNLYFMVPGYSDSAYYLMQNHDPEGTSVNLTDRFDIPVGAEIFFMYVNVQNCGSDCGYEYYSGQNRPNVDPEDQTTYPEASFVSEAQMADGKTRAGIDLSGNRRFCVAGRMKDNDGNPTDVAEFGFEDIANGGDVDFDDIIFHVSGLSLTVELGADSLALEAYPDTARIPAGDSVKYLVKVFSYVDSLDSLVHNPRLDSTATWELVGNAANRPLKHGAGPAPENWFYGTVAYEWYTVKVSVTDPSSGQILYDSMKVYVQPGPADHLVIEADADTGTQAKKQNDTPVDTVRMSPTVQDTAVYAIVRDAFGNFVDYSKNTVWNIVSGDYVNVSGHNGGVGRGTISKEGHSDTATVSATDTDHSVSDRVTVIVANEPPVANDDVYSIQEDEVLTTPSAGNPPVLANDADSDPATVLSASLVSGPSQGNLTFNNDGSFSYVPETNFNGSVTFTYTASDGEYTSNTATVTITVGADNDAPSATADTYTTDEDTTLNVNASSGVLANDTDIDGDGLTAVLIEGPDPAKGILAFDTDGSFTFDPATDYHGSATFTYQAFDGAAFSEVTTVTITINSVNDIPVADDDQYSTNEDVPLSVSAAGVLDNDADNDGDGLSAVLVDDVSHGTLSLNGNGGFAYTPSPQFHGADSFTYRANDGTANSNIATVRITVNSVNDVPFAVDDIYNTKEDVTLTVSAPGVLENDSDNDGDDLDAVLVNGIPSATGTLSLNQNGAFSYAPEPDYNGTVSFTYKATDGSASSYNAIVSITVTAVNDKPEANNDIYAVALNDTLTVGVSQGVLANDVDVDGDGLTVSLTDPPDYGTLTLDTDGAFTYVPKADTAGDFTFSYEVSDNAQGTPLLDTATVTVRVGADNEPPIATADSYAIGEDTTLTVDAANGVLSNDTDPNGDPLTAQLLQGIESSKGSLTLNGNGSFVYTPKSNYNGTATFTYQADDGMLTSAVCTVTVTVREANDVPVVGNDDYTTNEDVPLSIPAAGMPGLLANDSDADGDALTTTLDRGIDASEGTLTLDSDGSFSYVPAQHYNGTLSFTYTAGDGTAESSPATVTITVAAVNDTPIIAAIPDQDTTKGNPFRSFDLDNYVSDADHGDSELSWTATGATDLSVSIDNTTHVVTVSTPDAYWDGSETVVFTVTDPSGLTQSDTVNFAIRKLGELSPPATDTVPGTHTGNTLAMNLYVSGHPSALIYYDYRTDGSVPPRPDSTSSDKLTGSGLVDFGTFTADSTQVNVIAYASEYPWEDSKTRTFRYLVVFPQLGAITVTPSSGTYKVTDQTVLLSVPDHSDAAIYYTLDGSDPASSSTREAYTGPIALGPYQTITNVTVRAYAEKTGFKSADTTLTYTFNPQALPEPVADPAGHVFTTDSVEVELSVPGSDSVVIRYTTDGSEPNENSTPYTGPITITDSTVVKAIAFKDGKLPGPVMTETYVKSIPTALQIHPSVDDDIPYPSTVNCSAGVRLPLIGRVFNQRDSALTKYETGDAPITWRVREVQGNDAGTLEDSTGYATAFEPTKAYTTVKVTATFQDDGVLLEREITLIVAPGKPYRLWIEADHDRQVSPNRPNAIDSVKLSSAKVNDQVYAIVRDSLGNYIAPSSATTWAPSSGTIATVADGRSSLGEGAISKGDDGGIVFVSARNTGLDLPYPTDSVAVQVLDYWYDTLKIVVDKSPVVEVDSITMNTNQDTVLYVLGHRDDGLSPEWEPVDATWELLDRSLNYIIAAPPRSDREYTLSPTDTASGRIRVTLGDDSIARPDTVWARFTPGPPTRVEFEVLTPADSLIAGRPITTAVRLYNDDNKLVQGRWCSEGSLGEAVYGDIQGSEGRPDPTLRVDDSTYVLDDQGTKVDQCVDSTGVDTVEFVLYYAPEGRSIPHLLSVNYGSNLSGSTKPFYLLPGELDSISIEKVDTAVDSIALTAGESVVLVTVGYDEYGNRRGRERSDWNATDSLHPIDRGDDTPQIYYSTKSVTDDEWGYIVAEATAPDGSTLKDSVWVDIKGPESELTTAVTRDHSGNGYLDAVELHFTKPVSFTGMDRGTLDSIISIQYPSTAGNQPIDFDIDSIVASTGSDTDTVFTVFLREDSSRSAPQTDWEPTVSITGLPEAYDVENQSTVDGAGPVIWSVVKRMTSASDRSKDRIIVTFSESILSDQSLLSLNTPPESLFVVWWQNEGGSLDTARGMLSGISDLQVAKGNRVEFLMDNEKDLLTRHYFNINVAPGMLSDAEAEPNEPEPDNRRVRIELITKPPDIAPSFPNPTRATFRREAPGVLNMNHQPLARQWARNDRAGSVVTFSVTRPTEGTIKAYIKIYDMVGNLVHSATNADLLAGLPAYASVYDIDVYWNGSNEKGMTVAPGVYRFVVYLDYDKDNLKDTKLYGNIGISK